MSDAFTLDLFVEDRAHEELLKPLVERIANEEGVDVVVRVRSARGGHARAIEEFKLYQMLIERGNVPGPPADLLVVGIDGNCTTFARKREEIRAAAHDDFAERLVVACRLPVPHEFTGSPFGANPARCARVQKASPTGVRSWALRAKAPRGGGSPTRLRASSRTKRSKHA